MDHRLSKECWDASGWWDGLFADAGDALSGRNRVFGHEAWCDSPNDSITMPHISHQSWKEKELPEKFGVWAGTWTDRHPGWEYRLWTDEDNRALVRIHYPYFL